MSDMRYTRHPLAGLSGIKRRRFLQYGALALGTSVVTACASNTSTTPVEESPAASGSDSAATSGELTKVTYGTNWFAQAEHGGFYQAVATGIYEEYGLDVSIQMGGPQVNGTQLLMGGAIDFFMGYGSLAIKSIEEGIPTVTVASIFQKDPQIIMAHPGTAETLADLKGRPVFISAAANTTFWPFLRAKFDFTDDMIRPYNFNPGPFLADETAGQQGERKRDGWNVGQCPTIQNRS